MKKILLILFVIILALSIYFFIPKKLSNIHSDKLTIGATIFPLYDITQNIVKDKADVIQILPIGASPHTFELTPEKVKELSDAKIIFKIGVLDDWIDPVSDSLPLVQKIAVNKNIVLLNSEEEGEQYDPHYWLSIKNAKIISQNIYDELIKIDPQNANIYKTNLDQYFIELDKAELIIKNQLANLKSNKLITFHDSWQYFANEYGLKVVGVFEPSPGQEPAPQYLKQITLTAEKYQIKTIFSEPQFSTGLIEQIAKDTNLKIYQLDAEGGGNAGKETYIKLMEYNSETIFTALNENN